MMGCPDGGDVAVVQLEDTVIYNGEEFIDVGAVSESRHMTCLRQLITEMLNSDYNNVTFECMMSICRHHYQ